MVSDQDEAGACAAIFDRGLCGRLKEVVEEKWEVSNLVYRVIDCKSAR